MAWGIPCSIRSSVNLLLVVGVLGPCSLAGPVLAASVEEDDEESFVGDLSFSAPSEILSAKRHAAESAGHSLLFGASAFMGTDDNVYRSPNAGARSGSAWGHWAYARNDLRIGERNRMLTTLNWKQTLYPGHSRLDGAYGHLSNWFTRRLSSTTSLELDMDLSHQNDDAVTITGADYAQNYGYWRSAGEAVLQWSPSPRHRLRASIEGVRKDYAETSGLNSIDWGQWTTSMAYRFRFGTSHWIDLSSALGRRGYRAEPASLVNGREEVSNPVERHRYRGMSIEYLRPLFHGVSLDVAYDYADKHDLFQGYEDYRRRGARLGLGLALTESFDLRFDSELARSNYDHLRGDNGASLKYSTHDVALGGRYRLRPDWSVFASVDRYERDSNKSRGTLYLDYHGVVTRAGMSVFF